MLMERKDFLFQMVKYDLHLSWCEDLSVDVAKLADERLYPPAYCAFVHLPTVGKLP